MTDWSAWQAEQEKQNAELEMLRQKNMATQQAQQQMQGVPMQVFQPYDVTGKGQISGGARNLGTNMWDFMDQAGNVLTSIPLQDFYSRYGNDGSGFYSNKPESINGVQVWNSSSPQAIQQKQGYEAQQAAMQSPGAWVNTGSGFGQVMYDPATGQFLHQQQAINTQPQGTSRISEAASMGWSPSAPGLANQFSTMFGNAFGAPTSSFGSLIDPRYSTSSGGNTLGGYGSAQPSFQAPLLESAFGKSAPDGSYYGLSAMDAQNKSQPSWAGMTNGWTGQAYAPPQTPQVQFGGQAEKMSAAGGAPSAPGMAGQASSMFSNAFGRSSGDVSSDWAAGPSMPPPSAPGGAQPPFQGGLLGGGNAGMGGGYGSSGGYPSIGQPLGQYTGGYANGRNSFGFQPFGMNNFFKNYWGR